MSWTDDRIALLTKMWAEGKSAAAIAARLGKGTTRNAVIGKAHRLGLSGRPSPLGQALPAAKRAAPVKKAGLLPAPRPESGRITSGGGLPLLEVTEGLCKWPLGDPRDDDFAFCGRASRQGVPYCPGHAALAYQSSGRARSSAPVSQVPAEDMPGIAAEDEAEDAIA